LLTPDITTLWVVGFLLLCTFLLNTMVFQPILRIIDARATAVRGAKELAESAAQKATAAAAEYDQKLNAARGEVYRQMDDMRKSALDKRATLLASTRATVEEELSAARRACSRSRMRRAPHSIATRPTWPARLCRAYSAGSLSNNGARDSEW
jgi:F-type H+-transporting ATPase subunit b